MWQSVTTAAADNIDHNSATAKESFHGTASYLPPFAGEEWIEALSSLEDLGMQAPRQSATCYTTTLMCPLSPSTSRSRLSQLLEWCH